MERHVNTLRCCGEILCNHPQSMLGNLLLDGLSITGKLHFFCVHTGWRPHGKARAPQWLRRPSANWPSNTRLGQHHVCLAETMQPFCHGAGSLDTHRPAALEDPWIDTE